MKKRKILSVLLVAVMCISMMPTTTFAKIYGESELPSLGFTRHEPEEGVYYLYDGSSEGTRLITDGADSDNYQIYYNDSKLILKDVDLKDVVLVPGGTTIEILGDVSISSSDGIQATSEGNITVTGEGKLEITVTNDGIIMEDGNSDVNLTGNLEIAMHCGAGAIGSRDGNVNISDSVKLISTGSQPVIGLTNGDIVLNDDAYIEASGSINTTYGDIIIQNNAQVTVDTAGFIAMVGSYDGKIEIKDNADVSLKGTSGITKFSGDLLVEKDAKLTAISTLSGKAAINMGDSSDSSKAQTITLAGTVTVNGFVGIGTTNEESQIIIDGAKKVDITSTLAGIYPMGGGKVRINKSDVSIKTEQFGIAVLSGTTEFENSTVEIDAGVMAFHTTVPELTYDNCRTISAGASQDEAIAIELNEEGVLPSDYTKSKYVKIAPTEHAPAQVATCHSKAVCKVCKQEYGEFDANNHDGETELRNALEATYTNAGYTGDTWCLGCNTMITAGSEIPILQRETTVVPETTTSGTETTTSGAKTTTSVIAPGRKAASFANGKISVTWKKVNGADGYDIYVSQCSKKFKKKNITKSVKNAKKVSTSIKKLNGKKLKANAKYKIKVKAYKFVNGKKKYVASSLTYHIVGNNNKKYTNPKKVTVSSGAVSLKVNASTKIQAKVVKTNKNKKMLSKKHGRKIRYISMDESVAVVNSNGKITAKGAGTCYVYVVALNGTFSKIKVTVQ